MGAFPHWNFWKWKGRPTCKLSNESKNSRRGFKYSRWLYKRGEGPHSWGMDKRSRGKSFKVIKIQSWKGWSIWTSIKKRWSGNQQASSGNQHAVSWAHFCQEWTFKMHHLFCKSYSSPCSCWMCNVSDARHEIVTTCQRRGDPLSIEMLLYTGFPWELVMKFLVATNTIQKL